MDVNCLKVAIAPDLCPSLRRAPSLPTCRQVLCVDFDPLPLEPHDLWSMFWLDHLLAFRGEFTESVKGRHLTSRKVKVAESNRDVVEVSFKPFL